MSKEKALDKPFATAYQMLIQLMTVIPSKQVSTLYHE